VKRFSSEEILDSHECPAHEIATTLRDIGRMNRWFGGVGTTRSMIERVASTTLARQLSMLEVAAGFGEVPTLAAQQLARRGITVDITHLDCKQSHLVAGSRAVVADALALPFPDGAFDLISCSLFAHHLEPEELAAFTREALRVSRCAVLINDLVRHPIHVALAYAGYPLMRSHVARVDGVTSVRRAYVPSEMREFLGSASLNGSPARLEILRHFLFRMGVIVWKSAGHANGRE
jgi:hypothetical protein